MHTIFSIDASKHITISDEFYFWLRDISPCALTYDEDVQAETIGDYLGWVGRFVADQQANGRSVSFRSLYSDKKTVDQAIEHQEFDRTDGRVTATLKKLGY